ncbi:PPOX class F420-dependent oxidoreductase [Mycobacterium sp.]|uniref:PPOX class F420-dependent oxidoreductase n=1 Tax=Mycobacterium sp. TaxID=1785 RepID=UPI003A83A297
MTYSPAEATFLQGQPIGRLATIGPAGESQIRPVSVHLSPDGSSIDIVGHALAKTQKWRNVIRNPKVAFIVDTVFSVHPPKAQGLEVRGVAAAMPGHGTTAGGLSGDIIRISPKRIVAWGLDSEGTTARDTAATAG